MIKKYLQLNDIDAYKTAFNLSNYVWKIVIQWDYFAKNTIGEQFVTAVDSISANIAEGFGRYSKKDKVKFYRYSSGSLKESFDWNQKSKVRKLLSEEGYNHIFGELKKLPKEINQLILFTNQKLTI
ncbi:MAG: four helix bundle protein [Bacteroidetes bacterium]|nr:four helix bundle protein [Bacteroidota bacterium]